MKTSWSTIVFWVLAVASTQGQVAQPVVPVNAGPGTVQAQETSYAVVSKGADEQVWQRTTYEMLPTGQTVPKIHTYTQLESGLNFWDSSSGQWMTSSEEIDISPDGNSAAATNGQQKLYFPGDLYNGVIEMVTPDGKTLRSQPMALGYDDGTNTVLIGVFTNATVAVLPSGNQVIYQNAFIGLNGFDADVLYQYTKSGFEQNIVIRSEPPTPESLGLNPATAKLQVFTEFFNPPAPAASTTILPAQAGIALSDQTLNFGVMEMGPGQAFLLGADAGAGNVLVGKQWVEVGDRQFLVEEVPVEAVANQLGTLPLPPEASAKTGTSVHPVATRQWPLPPPHLAQAGKTGPFRRLAQASALSPGLVLDYQTLNGSRTNFTFQGDTTYYFSGSLYSYGTNTFEGGAVLKFATNGSLAINPGPPGTSPGINWKAGAYRPVIFTAKDDNSVGASIGTGNPTGYYGNPMLALNSFSPSVPFIGLRMNYAKTAIQCGGASASFQSIQFVNCQNGLNLGGGNVFFGNALFANTKTNFVFSGGATINGQNITFDSATCLAKGPAFPGDTLTLTNCILSNVSALTNGIVAKSGLTNGFYNSPTFGTGALTASANPFQAVGAGNYYLTNGCSFFNAGTTNINSTLLAALRQRTTYPPMVFSNIVISGNTIFSPQVQRDTDVPDLGFHYDPIDYAVNGVSINNAIVAVYPGTAIAAFGTSNTAFGLDLETGSELLCKGLATNWNRVVAYNTVQEQPGTAWQTPANGLIIDLSGSSSSSFSGRFTDWSVVAQDDPHLAISNNTSVVLRDCQFHGGSLFLDYPAMLSSIDSKPVLLASDPTLNNCLLERVNTDLYVDDGSSTSVQNDLFWRGTFNYTPNNGDAVVQNNLFDQTMIPDSGATSYMGGYNAYVTNFDQLQPPSANDLTLTNSPAYQLGPLGNYYQPSNSWLINAGSTNADALGLYDYTVTTNLVNGQEIKETNGIVDIGYHYVAVDTNGSPLSTYGYAFPDYLTNSSLDAIPDWWEYLYFGNLDLATNEDYDNDGTNILAEYQNGIDPNKISFFFSVVSQYVTNSLVNGTITIFNGVPSSFAVLVDSTNFTTAIWGPYTSSNITINVGTAQGAHDVWIGLRGLPANVQQTWQETTIILDSVPPTISITNPVNNVSFNASRVNVSGSFTTAALHQITVSGIPAFVNGTSFEVRNVPLSGGANTVTAIVEDLTGTTNAVSISVTGITNSDGSLNDPVQLVATPVAGFSPLSVGYTVSANEPGTLQQVCWDFNGDDLTDFVTNNAGPVAYTYSTNGEYFPVVTIQTTVGRFSSVGGWNAVSLNSTNQPIRINVQNAPTQTTFLSYFPNPVDLKWDGTNLYVLSGSGAAIYEFATNGDTIRSLSLPGGSNPSGLDVDAAGSVYVALTGSNQVWKYFPTNSSFQADTNFGIGGCIGFTNGASGSDTNEFNAPFDVAVSPDGGTISVSDTGNNRIQQISAANGAFITSFGSSGSDVGQFNAPKGLTYDSSGTLYIVDSGNNRVVLARGTFVEEVTGTYGTALAQLSGPANISVGERGVYIADAGNNRIQSFNPSASHSLFSIDPSTIREAVSSGISAPAAVAAVDALTNEMFYAADTGNNRVILCQVPDQNADAILAVWNGMTGRIAVGDINGAISYFSVESADDYRDLFFTVGTNNTVSTIGTIGTLTPSLIQNDQGEYHYADSANGQPITGFVRFVNENGVWKILEF